ncbi:MAG TPA: rRNA maturation RNase YbeY [Acidimicrobiales bacterium]|nr:rRNA maturation RNase YbeY [Acidimicrobiales bacterium]
MTAEYKDTKKMTRSNNTLNVVFADDRKETSTEPTLNSEEVVGLAVAVLEEEGLGNRNIELTVHFVDEEPMANLNTEHMNKIGATDVLAFPLDDPKRSTNLSEFLLLGDVVICPKVADRQAMHHSYEAEISLLLIHGILHLLGYDHGEEDEKQIMESRQKNILKQHGLDKK